jgi:hypothetical protein
VDRSLSYQQHLDEVKAKITARVSLIRRLAGSTWGASPQTLRISTQALVLPVAEYCAPAWSRSPHVKKVDTAINSALRIVTGCLKPTPVSHLPVLAGIAPASLRRDAATLTLARKAQKYDWHILHKATITQAPPGWLKSRHPYNKAAQEMLQSIPDDLSRDAWMAASWKQTWETAGPSRIQRYIRDPGGGVKGEDLPRHLWTSLNRPHTGVGRFQ